MAGFIKYLLTIWGVFEFLSSIMWMLTEGDNKWLWYSRFIGCILCLGFAGVIDAIEKNKKEEK